MELTDKASFRDAMAHVGAAVNIITTDGPAGRGVHRQRGLQRYRHAADPAGLPEPLGFGGRVQRTPHAVRQYSAAGQEALSTLFGGKRQWTSVLPPPTGRPAPPAVRGWRRLWSALTAASTSASASGRTTFCFVTSGYSSPGAPGTDVV